MDQLKNINFMALGIAGALIYISTSVLSGKQGAARAALMAVGSVMVAKQVPVVRDYV